MLQPRLVHGEAVRLRLDPLRHRGVALRPVQQPLQPRAEILPGLGHRRLDAGHDLGKVAVLIIQLALGGHVHRHGDIGGEVGIDAAHGPPGQLVALHGGERIHRQHLFSDDLDFLDQRLLVGHVADVDGHAQPELALDFLGAAEQRLVVGGAGDRAQLVPGQIGLAELERHPINLAQRGEEIIYEILLVGRGLGLGDLRVRLAEVVGAAALDAGEGLVVVLRRAKAHSLIVVLAVALDLAQGRDLQLHVRAVGRDEDRRDRGDGGAVHRQVVERLGAPLVGHHQLRHAAGIQQAHIERLAGEEHAGVLPVRVVQQHAVVGGVVHLVVPRQQIDAHDAVLVGGAEIGADDLVVALVLLDARLPQFDLVHAGAVIFREERLALELQDLLAEIPVPALADGLLADLRLGQPFADVVVAHALEVARRVRRQEQVLEQPVGHPARLVGADVRHGDAANSLCAKLADRLGCSSRLHPREIFLEQLQRLGLAARVLQKSQQLDLLRLADADAQLLQLLHYQPHEVLQLDLLHAQPGLLMPVNAHDGRGGAIAVDIF